MNCIPTKSIYQMHYYDVKFNLTKSNYINRKFWRERVCFLYKILKQMGEQPKKPLTKQR